MGSSRWHRPRLYNTIVGLFLLLTGLLPIPLLAYYFYLRISAPSLFGGSHDWSGLFIVPAIILVVLSLPPGVYMLKKQYWSSFAVLPLGIMTTAIVSYIYSEINAALEGYQRASFEIPGLPILVLVTSTIVVMDVLYYLGWRRRKAV